MLFTRRTVFVWILTTLQMYKIFRYASIVIIVLQLFKYILWIQISVKTKLRFYIKWKTFTLLLYIAWFRKTNSFEINEPDIWGFWMEFIWIFKFFQLFRHSNFCSLLIINAIELKKILKMKLILNVASIKHSYFHLFNLLLSKKFPQSTIY